ncbi:MAG: hypothetical protein V9F01_13840 [Chitinophagaceae bacterium]
MTNLPEIVKKLKEEYPLYQFHICKGLFEKYIAVISMNKIIFTIWVDKKSGSKELLDEVKLFTSDWFKLSCKTKLFHWSKYRKLPSRNYPRLIIESVELSSPERKKLRQRLELSLQNIHL